MIKILPVILALVACAPARRPAPARAEYRAETAVLAGPVDEDSVAPLIELFAEAPASVTLVIDSPGGGVYAGLDLIEAMQNAQYRGTHITCAVPRLAASMASFILEACDVRLMGKQAALLFHTVSISMASGNRWDLVRLAKEMDSLNRRLAIFVSGRLTISFDEYQARVEDTDYWVGWEEAMEIGAIDGVL
jgi:ATP-dependent protease ClpP protease subunit